MATDWTFLKRPALRSVGLLLVTTMVLTACNGGLRASFQSRKNKETFEGFQYKARSKQVTKENRDHFEVVVSRANQSLIGARQAGAHEAVKYCIKEYGTSKMDWILGPDSETIIPVDDKIRLEGFCRP